MTDKASTVTLNVKITVDTLENGIKKTESFARLIEKLSECEECRGITKLSVSAEMG